jgi:hypothetical protein
MQREDKGEKQTAKTKAINQSLRPSGFAPAFGRAVGPSAGFFGTAEQAAEKHLAIWWRLNY